MTYSSAAFVSRPRLMAAMVVFFLSAIVLTIILILPSSAQKIIPSAEAADFIGYIGTVCGRVTSIDNDPKFINELLLFGDPTSPSFAVSIFPPGRDPKKYEGNRVCVMGRIVNGSGDEIPTIRVNDESQISIQRARD